MNIIKNEVASKLPIISEKITCFNGLKPAVIDIETTGLSPDRAFVYLIGVLTNTEGGTRVTQFLASSKSEEKEMLAAFFDFIEDFDIYLNYNGTAFDIPFINRRSEKLKLNRSLDVRRSVDYLKLLRASYVKKILPDLKLKTVERLAGVIREDKFSGKDCIELYRHFSEKGDKAAGKFLLLHNFEDLSCFPALNSILEKIDLYGALLKTGFPVKAGEAMYYISDVKVAGQVTVKGEVEGLSMDVELYGENHTLMANALKEGFSLKFDVFSEPGEGASAIQIFREIEKLLTENY